MTRRAVAMAVLGVALAIVGWHTGWPELSALGAAGGVLVVATVLIAGPRPAGAVELDSQSLRVTRGDAASVRMSVRTGRRTRWLRLVEGAVRAPSRSLGMPAAARDASAALKMPIDTSTRGQRPIGPYSIVHSDPWSLVRRVVASADGGVVTVLPRVYPMRRSLIATVITDESELSSRRAGEQHFHALRDYVLGDEPRMIHWRSSARAGHLVVRQQVAAATNGTTIVLDCDLTAYGSDERFGSAWVPDRFENAVEVAASVCATDLGRREQVNLLTSARDSSLISSMAGAPAGFLDRLAVVSAIAPLETLPQELPTRVRRTRCARVIVVTGSPGRPMTEAMYQIRRTGTSLVVIRVGARQPQSLTGLRVIDVDRPQELA
jgi:uncharacterized protein (DUF58 family)